MHQRLVFLLFYFIFLKSRYVHCSTDETKLDGAYGIHVVDAVIQILKDKCIISDHMFLRRIAEIATNNGLDLQNSTSNSGGIWKVDQQKFDEIRAHSSKLSRQELTIFGNLNIDWSKVTWVDMTKPLMSGLASFLFLQTISTPIPENLEEQATFYSTYYDNKTAAHDFYARFINRSYSSCLSTPKDVVILVDTSAGMTPIDLAYTRIFLKELSSDLMRNNDTQVALVNTSPSVVSYLDNKNVNASIDLLYSITGTADIGSALNITSSVFDIKKGMRTNSAKIVLLLLHSNFTNMMELVQKAAVLKDKEINLFVVSVGGSLDSGKLEQIASTPGCSSSVKVSEYFRLGMEKEEILDILCTAPEILTVGTHIRPCDTISNLKILNHGERYTIQINVEKGDQMVYASFFTSQPSRSYNDMSGLARKSDPLILHSEDNADIFLKMDKSQTCEGNVTIVISLDQSLPGCRADQFRCTDGECVKATDRCNDQFDCHDMSDEQQCIKNRVCPEGLWRCNDGQCINKVFRCDGHFQCPDKSDESGCNSSNIASCNNQTIDVVFVVDTSLGETDSEYFSIKQFIKTFVNEFLIGPNNMLVSVVTYEDTYRNQFWLNEHKTKQSLLQALDGMPRHYGQRYTGEALRFVQVESFSSIHGGRFGALQVVVLLTTGTPVDTKDTMTYVQQLHSTGFRLIVVGIGQSINRTELNSMVSDGKHLFTVNHFEELNTIAAGVSKITCGVVQIMCVEAGIVRNCTMKDIQHSSFAKPETALPNICPSGIKQAPHPTDDTKYLMCDDEDQLLLVQCPLNEYYCKNIKHCNTSCI